MDFWQMYVLYEALRKYQETIQKKDVIKNRYQQGEQALEQAQYDFRDAINNGQKADEVLISLIERELAAHENIRENTALNVLRWVFCILYLGDINKILE